MQILIVQVRVKPDCVEAFKTATLDNARHSQAEPGIERFDVLQQPDDPTRFVLYEVYKTADAPAAHKATAHYQRWRELAEPLLAEPRTRTVYHEVCWTR